MTERNIMCWCHRVQATIWPRQAWQSGAWFIMPAYELYKYQENVKLIASLKTSFLSRKQKWELFERDVSWSGASSRVLAAFRVWVLLSLVVEEDGDFQCPIVTIQMLLTFKEIVLVVPPSLFFFTAPFLLNVTPSFLFNFRPIDLSPDFYPFLFMPTWPLTSSWLEIISLFFNFFFLSFPPDMFKCVRSRTFWRRSDRSTSDNKTY